MKGTILPSLRSRGALDAHPYHNQGRTTTNKKRRRQTDRQTDTCTIPPAGSQQKITKTLRPRSRQTRREEETKARHGKKKQTARPPMKIITAFNQRASCALATRTGCLVHIDSSSAAKEEKQQWGAGAVHRFLPPTPKSLKLKPKHASHLCEHKKRVAREAFLLWREGVGWALSCEVYGKAETPYTFAVEFRLLRLTATKRAPPSTLRLCALSSPRDA